MSEENWNESEILKGGNQFGYRKFWCGAYGMGKFKFPQEKTMIQIGGFLVRYLLSLIYFYSELLPPPHNFSRL